MVPGPEALARSGNWSEMQILWPHPKPIKSGTLSLEPEEFALTILPGDSNAHQGLKISALIYNVNKF